MKREIEIGRATDGRPVMMDVDLMLRSGLLVQANSGGGKSWLLRRLAEQLCAIVPTFVVDVEGEFASLREKFPFFLVAKSGGDATADPTKAAALARKLLELRVSAVFDLYELDATPKPGELVAERHAWVRAFLEAMDKAPKDLWGDTAILIDEAHVFAPERGKGDSVALGGMSALASRGRKRGFGPVDATQRIGKFHKDVAAELKNAGIGLTWLDIDRDRAIDTLGVGRKEREDFDRQLRHLEPGEFFLIGRAFGTIEPVKVKVGPVQSTHPEPGQAKQTAAPPPPAKIRSILAKLGDLPKEAPAPEGEAGAGAARELVAGLRRKIAELEARDTSPKLIPVFPAKMLDGLVAAVDCAKSVRAELGQAIDGLEVLVKDGRAHAQENGTSNGRPARQIPPSSASAIPAAPTARREPKMTRAPREGGDSAAKPGSQEQRIVAEMRELAPWAGALAGTRRTIFEARCKGTKPAAIAQKLGIPRGRVTVQVCVIRNQLRELKAAGPPASKPANDSEDESEPAPAASVKEAASRLIAARAAHAPIKPRERAQQVAWDLLGADGIGFVAPASEIDKLELDLSPAEREGPEIVNQGTPVALEEITRPPSGPREAPGVPSWTLAWLHEETWKAYHAVIVEGCSAETAAFTMGVSLQKVHASVHAAKDKIAKLLSWERERLAEGNPLTDADRMPPARELRDPLLDALGIPQPPKKRRRIEEPPGTNTTHDGRVAEFRRHAPFFDLLDDRCRSVAVLVSQGYSTDAIASELRIKRFDVYQQIDKAIERLRRAEGERARMDAEAVPAAVALDHTDVDELPTNQRVEEIRRKSAGRQTMTGRVRSRTIAPGRLGRAERRLSELLVYPDDVERPVTREHCGQMARPCPFVSCSHHLYLDVNPETGAIKLNFPHLNVWEMAETCSLDVADRGGITLEEVGAILNLTRERIRQVEVRGLAKLKDDHGETLIDAESPERFESPLGGAIG